MDLQSQAQAHSFEPHGVYCVSNALSYEIELSSDGDALRARRTLYNGTVEVTDFIEIEAADFDKRIARNVFGFDIDLSQVMRLHGKR